MLGCGDQKVLHPPNCRGWLEVTADQRAGGESRDSDIRQSDPQIIGDLIVASRFNPAQLDIEAGRELTEKALFLLLEITVNRSVEKPGSNHHSKLTPVPDLFQVRQMSTVRGTGGNAQQQGRGHSYVELTSSLIHVSVPVEAAVRVTRLLYIEPSCRSAWPGKRPRGASLKAANSLPSLNLDKIGVLQGNPNAWNPHGGGQVSVISFETMNEEGNGPATPDLRPLIARLRDIQRRCGAMGSRNEEFPLMEERLGSIIQRLEAGEEDSGEPLQFMDMARELFPITHLFESYGFTTVGKEIAHIERALRDLAPDSASESVPSVLQPQTPIETPAPESADDPRKTEDEKTTGEGIPTPVLIGLLVLVGAIATAGAIILLRSPIQPDLVIEPTAPPTTTTTEQSPQPQPTSIARPISETPPPAARLAEAIGEARLALNRGDLDAAIDHLSAAALVDVDDNSVLETAQRVVDGLVGAADAAANRGEWSTAEERLARARRVAMRYGLSTAKVESAQRRYASMERFQIFAPEDVGSIRDAKGKRVVVTLLNGSIREGRVHGVEGASLLLDVDSDVGGGGTMRYTDEIPLAEIREIKAFPN
jgi:hypothetical protein